jgi:hypothetical protein
VSGERKSSLADPHGGPAATALVKLYIQHVQRLIVQDMTASQVHVDRRPMHVVEEYYDDLFSQ